jgi:ubiquinone/menaquinone biosynthesis C-methylase UbiE
MKINIGAGYKRYPDYINLDSDKNCKPDYIVNLELDKLPLKDNSVTHVIAHHILEHIGEGYFHLLKELYRVCEHGAIIDIRVPHHNHEVFHNDPTHRRPITVEGIRLFSKKVNQYEIETNGTSSTLGLMFDVDFEIVSFDYVYDPFYHKIMQTNTHEQNERLFREAVNTTLETHIVLTVVKE